jgi:WD40 repeat protein
MRTRVWQLFTLRNAKITWLCEQSSPFSYRQVVAFFVVISQVFCFWPTPADATDIEVVPNTYQETEPSSLAYLSFEGAELVISAVSTSNPSDNLRIWNTQSGRVIREILLPFEPEWRSVNSLQVAEKTAGILFDDQLFDGQSGRLVKTFRDGAASSKLDFADLCATRSITPDAAVVAIARDSGVTEIYDGKSGELRRRLKLPKHEVSTVMLTVDGSRVLVGGVYRGLQFLDEHLVSSNGNQFISRYQSKSGTIIGSAYSFDENQIAVAATDGTIKLLDRKTFKTLWTFSWIKEARNLDFDGEGLNERGVLFRFTPDGRELLVSTAVAVFRLSMTSGSLLDTFILPGRGDCVPINKSGTSIVQKRGLDPDSNDWIDQADFSNWSLQSKKSQRVFNSAPKLLVGRHDLSPNGDLIALGGRNGQLELWSRVEARTIAKVYGHNGSIDDLNFSADGRFIVTTGSDQKIRSWRVEPAKITLISTQEMPYFEAASIALSQDGSFLLTGGFDNTARLWSFPELRPLRTFGKSNKGKPLEQVTSHYFDYVHAVAFGPDGETVIAGQGDGTLRIWSRLNGKLLRTLRSELGEYGGGGISFRNINSIALAPTGQLAASNESGFVTVWPSVNGGKSQSLSYGMNRSITGLVYSYPHKSFLVYGPKKILLHDPSNLLSFKKIEGINSEKIQTLVTREGANGILVVQEDASVVRLIDLKANARSILLFNGPDETRVVITSDGFFAFEGSTDGSKLPISIVDGLRSYSVTQFYEQLYRPDLVQEWLKDDPELKYARAVEKINLQKILDSGVAPRVTLLSDDPDVAGDTVEVSVRITDNGGGIGDKVVWRVNGQTMEGKSQLIRAPEGFVDAVNVLRVDPREHNTIEVTAYNSNGLFASEPLSFVVDPWGAGPDGGADLYVLSIGVGNYAMPDYKLLFPGEDAKAIARTLEAAGKRGLFVKVAPPIVLTEEDVTQEKIQSAFEELRAKVKPKDVFVLFVSGHGNYVDGRYYFIPQDFDKKKGDTAGKKWISHDQWADWLKKIEANKQFIILDTCDSGAATDLLKGSTERQTALDQLRYATGRGILAASEGRARESNQLGHGVLTYSILQSLKAAPGKPPQDITINDLAKEASLQVLKIRTNLWNEPITTVQHLPKNDFSLGTQVAFDLKQIVEPPPSVQRYVIIEDSILHVAATEDSKSSRPLPIEAGAEITVEEFISDNWAFISRKGAKLGFVKSDSIAKLH